MRKTQIIKSYGTELGVKLLSQPFVMRAFDQPGNFGWTTQDFPRMNSATMCPFRNSFSCEVHLGGEVPKRIEPSGTGKRNRSPSPLVRV